MPTPDSRQTTLDLPTGDGAATPDPPAPAESRPGFRHVKRLGWVPEDWETTALGDVTRTFSGGTPSRGHPEYFGGAIPWIKSGEVNRGVVLDTEESITEAGLAKSSAKYVEPETTLLCLYGATAGVIGVAGIRATINQAILAVAPAPRKLDSAYMRFALQEEMPRTLHRLTQGGQPNLSGKLVKQIVLRKPPLPEQRKIARILGAWDEALAQLVALIAAKEERLKGLAQRLLTGEERLPGFTEEWGPQQLGSYFSHFSKRNRDGEDLTVLSCSKVHGIIPQAELFDKRIASDDTSNYKVVQHGDLVYDPMLLWDASIGFVEAVARGVISPAYASFKLKEKTADRSFFKHFFDGHYMRHQYKVISQGTNRRRRKAMASDFLKIGSPMPEKNEQAAIAAVLDTAEAEIGLLRRERDALAQQKKGLMQRLLTGEVRVTPDSDGQV
jgi:type I restriction enzyme S subunit